MRTMTKLEARHLNASELEIVALLRDSSSTRYPDIEQQSTEQLKAVARPLREAQDRAKNIGSRQQREMRGKVDPHGAKRTRDNSGTSENASVAPRGDGAP
jgi:hypothetical protein